MPVNHLAAILGAYLIGGLPAGLLIARTRGIHDIRRYGSGNIGASNILRTLGVKMGLLVWAIDCFGKGMAPVLLARYLVGSEGWWLAATAVAAVAGHCYSPYLRLTGGRGVSTGLGVLLGLFWPVGLSSLMVFILVVAAARIISLGSVLAATTAPIWMVVWGAYVGEYTTAYAVMTAAFALIIIIRHRPNIARLIRGTERRIGQRVEVDEADHGEPDQGDNARE